MQKTSYEMRISDWISDVCSSDLWHQGVKRSLDVMLSIVLVIVALPLLGATALAIRVETPGPVFYRQKRVGLNSRAFDIIKFRSMAVDAETDGPVWAARNDPRITDVGRNTRKDRKSTSLNSSH